MEKEFNPLDLLSKEQIKIVLKQHSKRELLGKALAWEVLASQYKKELDKLKENKDEHGE
tara:strand:- start:202 stop:378 length:177 start_codon:yes stop_codon:yes gene_type:complete